MSETKQLGGECESSKRDACIALCGIGDGARTMRQLLRELVEISGRNKWAQIFPVGNFSFLSAKVFFVSINNIFLSE